MCCLWTFQFYSSSCFLWKLCCLWICLSYSSLCCLWTRLTSWREVCAALEVQYLSYSNLNCLRTVSVLHQLLLLWTYLFYSKLCCLYSRRVFPTAACAAFGRATALYWAALYHNWTMLHPTELSCTLPSHAAPCWAPLNPTELSCVLPSHTAPCMLRYAAPYWATLYYWVVLSYAASFWAMLHPSERILRCLREIIFAAQPACGKDF